MPLLEPREVVALGLSPKDIPAHKHQAPPRKGPRGASKVDVGASSSGGGVTDTAHTPRRNPRKLLSTSSHYSRSNSSLSASNSASPTLSSSRFALGAGAEIGGNFEVCIKIPSKRKLAVLQRYERFPSVDTAVTKEAQTGPENPSEEQQHNKKEPNEREVQEGSTTMPSAEAESSIEPVKEDKPADPMHSNGPNDIIEIVSNGKEPLPVSEATIATIDGDDVDISL